MLQIFSIFHEKRHQTNAIKSSFGEISLLHFVQVYNKSRLLVPTASPSAWEGVNKEVVKGASRNDSHIMNASHGATQPSEV